MPVSLFKEKIANETGVPVGQQRLIFRGKVLKDDHHLSEYRILPYHDFFFHFLCGRKLKNDVMTLHIITLDHISLLLVSNYNSSDIGHINL